MLGTNLELTEISALDVAEDLQFARGLLCAVAGSLPLWGMIIALVKLVL